MLAKSPAANSVHSMKDSPNIELDAPDVVLSAFPTVPSRWPLVTKTVRIGSGVAGVGLQVTQQALGTTIIIALFTAGAALATVIGLIVGGAVVTLGTITASARSAFKTHKYLKALKLLLARAKGMPCNSIGPDGKKGQCNQAEHLEVVEALDYLIHKKERNWGKKSPERSAVASASRGTVRKVRER